MQLTLLVMVWAFGFTLTFLLTPWIGRFMLKHGIVGVDVHKGERPIIPEMVGITIWIGVTSASIIPLIIHSYQRIYLISLISTPIIAGLIGLIDDLHPLNPKVKPLLTAFAAAPILLLHTYVPYLMIPFIGSARLTIIYPLMIPVAIAVTSNAVNMMDVFNGVLPATTGIISFFAMAILLILGRGDLSYFAAALTASLMAFYLYNRYPAKVFSGDSGSLYVGAALGALAIVGRIEVFMVVALMPYIMNAFYGLSSVGRLYERREIKARPILLLEDGRLDASRDEGAPITLARLILAHGPLDERKTVYVMVTLTILSTILALITFTFTYLP